MRKKIREKLSRLVPLLRLREKRVPEFRFVPSDISMEGVPAIGDWKEFEEKVGKEV